jgi:protein ImuB
MLSLLRLSLEAHPPPAPVTRIAVSASPVALRPAPRELWEPAGPATRDLETVLARLVTLATPQNVGSPVITDSHRPDAFVLAPFVPRGSASRRASAWTLRPPRSRYVACAPAPHRGSDRRHRARCRPAPARLLLDGRAPVRVVTCAGLARHRRVVGRAPWSRDEWDVELADGLVCRLARDRIQGHWYLDGVYD